MSNEYIPQPRPGGKDPFVEKMEVESDKRLGKFVGTSRSSARPSSPTA